MSFNLTQRTSIYILVATLYATGMNNAWALTTQPEEAPLYTILSNGVGIDLFFNLIGAGAGGLVHLCLMYNSGNFYVNQSRWTILSQLIVSVIGGGVFFLLTEGDTPLHIKDATTQLAFVMIFGAFSAEGWQFLRALFLRRYQPTEPTTKENDQVENAKVALKSPQGVEKGTPSHKTENAAKQ